jgi:hypothetical protein
MQINSQQSEVADSSAQSEVFKNRRYRLDSVPHGSSLSVGNVSSALESQGTLKPERCH